VGWEKSPGESIGKIVTHGGSGDKNILVIFVSLQHNLAESSSSREFQESARWPSPVNDTVPTPENPISVANPESIGLPTRFPGVTLRQRVSSFWEDARCVKFRW